MGPGLSSGQKAPTSEGTREQPKPKAAASLTFLTLVWKKDQQSHHSALGGRKEQRCGK